MANTKNLDPAARRKAKKEIRKKNKKLYHDLTFKQLKKLRAFEGGGFKQFLTSLEKEKEEETAQAK